MELTDILSLEKWIELEKDVYKRSGLDSNVFNTKGIRITDYKQWVNRFCPKVKADDRGQSFICAVAHMNIAEMAKNAKGPVIEECDAGLLKLVVPIFLDDAFIGAFGACGMILDDGEVDSFMVNKTIGMDEAEIESLSHDIKHISTEAVINLAAYIVAEIGKIVADYQK
ncbi:MAG: PocR ligand-binding domain-containing protein [Desulfobacteraceae bacterium]|nr:PocR ligand-binding domain-containing protein [Desulfobacteraceae bacterium]